MPVPPIRRRLPFALPRSTVVATGIRLAKKINRASHVLAVITNNNACERAMRPVAMVHKNWVFVASKPAGDRAAVLMSMIASRKADLVEPGPCSKRC